MTWIGSPEMKFIETSLSGAYIVEPSPIEDDRGSFARLFCSRTFRDAGLVGQFLQTNHATTQMAGTIRGLHYQIPPHAEVKLLRCTRGEVFDVIVDVRLGSPTFMHWHGQRLTDRDNKMIYVPHGFAHGYQTLTDGAEVSYQSSSEYSPESERRVRFDDPRVGIEWAHDRCEVSRKDAASEYLSAEFEGIDIQ